uniref:Uncharacterized protein n=1 Tax=Paenibacillus athensensis TaxID=1967502 RepID=A0A4Y8PT10_9BACL
MSLYLLNSQMRWTEANKKTTPPSLKFSLKALFTERSTTYYYEKIRTSMKIVNENFRFLDFCDNAEILDEICFETLVNCMIKAFLHEYKCEKRRIN